MCWILVDHVPFRSLGTSKIFQQYWKCIIWARLLPKHHLWQPYVYHSKTFWEKAMDLPHDYMDGGTLAIDSVFMDMNLPGQIHHLLPRWGNTASPLYTTAPSLVNHW
jgi:hypothetical protein